MCRAQTCSTVCSNRPPRFSFRRFFTRIGSPQLFILLHFTNIKRNSTARYFQICQSKGRKCEFSVIKTGTRVTPVEYRRSLNQGTRDRWNPARERCVRNAGTRATDWYDDPPITPSGDAHAQNETALFLSYSMEVIAEKNASSGKNTDRSIAYDVARGILFLILIYF